MSKTFVDNNYYDFKMSYNIKTAYISDVQAMRDLNELTLPENYSLDEWKSVLSTYPDASICAWNGSENNKTLVGYVLVLLNSSFFSMKREAHIASFAVHPDYRKLGIGKSLLDACFKTICQNGFSTVSLNVRVDNVAALALYRKSGFHVEYEQRGYYVDGTNAYNMVKNLNTV